MPRASGQKFHYRDHDTDEVYEDPPVQNQWYEVFHEEDVRLIWCTIQQTNTDTVAKDVEVRWTIDGNVYFLTVSMESGVWHWIFRNFIPSTGGTAGLESDQVIRNAGHAVDKRGLDFKVEVRTTSAPGTAQVLICRCVRETKELT